ncbi:MAG: hypothetical protein E6H88_11975 [Chloroflexi bacterium]|nr:MAG: hypothetical protein E6H88_11975 [Chloroflexota bacterium]
MHPLEDLSAYLDGELDGGRRAAVESHLAACDSCRTRLAQLRATARLIAALPSPVPARSLVPRVAVPIWLAPLRTLATIGSGAALFLFIASALTTSFTQTSSGGAAAPALAPQPEQVQSDRARGIASAGPSGAAGAAGPAGPSGPSVPSIPTGVPAPAFGVAASVPPPQKSVTESDRSAAGTPTPTPVVRADTGTTAPTAVALGAPERAPTTPSPLVWLALAIALAVLALVLHRRLRSA